MKIIASLVGVLALISAFAISGLAENNSGVCAFIFFGYCALIVGAQFILAIVFFVCLAKVIISVVSKSVVVQKN